MRHRVAGRKLNRTSEHRLAMRRNLVSSLFEHETVRTTKPKAKEVRAFAEKLITLAKKGDLHARRRAIALLGNRAIHKEVEGKMVKTGSVISKLFSEIGPKYLNRPGGYTRIIRLADRRLGDNGELVLLQLVEEMKAAPKKASSKKKTSKKTVKAAPIEEVSADQIAKEDSTKETKPAEEEQKPQE